MGGERMGQLDRKLAQEIVNKHKSLNFIASDAFRAKQERIHGAEVVLRMKEKKVRRNKEGTVLLALSVQMSQLNDRGIIKEEPKGPDELNYLNREEKEVYQEMISQCVRDESSSPDIQEGLRVTMTEVIFRPQVFRQYYKKWETQYKSKPYLNKEFQTFESYVQEQGRVFIASQRNQIVLSRLQEFKKKQPGRTPNEGNQLEQNVKKYFAQNQNELLSYVTLDQTKREEIFQRFVTELKLKEAPTEETRKLFEAIIEDMEVAYASEKKWDARSEKMIEYIKVHPLDADEDEEAWDAMLDKALKDDPFFNETLPEQKQNPTVYSDETGAESVISAKPLDTAEAAALEAGVRVLHAIDKDKNIYKVEFPDSGYQTTMRMEFPEEKPGQKKKKGGGRFDEAIFIFSDKYADKGAEKRFSREELRSGCNQMFLDYLMNGWIREKTDHSPDFSANTILKDDTMARMASNLFGKNLGEITLTEEKRAMFTRFLQVLLKGDSDELGSFKARVEKMDTVLRQPKYAQRLLNVFKKEGSVTFTVSKILNEIDYKDAGSL